MTNAKNEFISTFKDLKVINVTIWVGNYKKERFFDLLKGYSDKAYIEFLDKLDFEYDSGYGGQNLFGIVACDGGVYFDRWEYDGSEGWDEHKYPDIDKIIKNRILEKLENEQIK